MGWLGHAGDALTGQPRVVVDRAGAVFLHRIAATRSVARGPVACAPPVVLEYEGLVAAVIGAHGIVDQTVFIRGAHERHFIADGDSYAVRFDASLLDEIRSRSPECVSRCIEIGPDTSHHAI